MIKTKKLVLSALFCALTAVAAQLVIPVQPVPFSFAMMAIYLTGALLDRRSAAYAQTAYLLLGAVGAPVFSYFTGGLAKLAGPTGGYLLVYPLMAYVVALSAEKWGRSYLKYCVSMSAALILCYAAGTAWLVASTGSTVMAGLTAGVLPFIPLDVLKVLGAAGLAVGLERALRRARLLPA